MAKTQIITYRYRVKDGGNSNRRALLRQARGVNRIWNYCCEVDKLAQSRYKAGLHVKRPSAFDLANLCRGITKELGVHSDTVDAVCKKFVDARSQCFPKTPRFRSYRRSLPWIPFSNFSRPAKINGKSIVVMKRHYRLWFDRPIPDDATLKSWSFSTDARGRWYINIAIEISVSVGAARGAVGVDLGLKTLATLSTGEEIQTPAFYRKAEKKLALYQRRNQKKRARALHAKIANQRKHFLHVATTKIAREFSEIYVGDVSPSRLSKTNMAKSIGDAGWAMLRSMLSYKAIKLGGVMRIVPERMTSQTCSCCGALPDTRPKGIAGLGMRHWDCSECGAVHNRDHNAALNILRVGLERQPPLVGITAI